MNCSSSFFLLSPLFYIHDFFFFSRKLVSTCVCVPAHAYMQATAVGVTNVILTNTSDQSGQVLEIPELIANSFSNN